jgi:O-antigen/teichoic acid export membrane protein
VKQSTSGPGSPGAPSPEVGIADPPGGHGRRLFRNTAINGIASVLALGINFALVAFAIRHLGGAAYGVWVLAYSFSASAGYLTISDLGLQEGIVKFVADVEGAGEPHRLGPLVSSSLALLTGLAVLAVVVLLVMAAIATSLFHVPGDLEATLRTLFLLLCVEAATGLPSLAFLALLEGKQHYGTIRAIKLGRQLVFALLVVATLMMGVGVVGLGLATAVASAVAAAATYVAAMRLSPGLHISLRLVSRVALRPLLGFSSWVFLGRISGVIWRQMDKLILAAMLTTTLLTGYEVASRLEAAASFPLIFTASAMLPATANLAAARSSRRLQDLLVRATRYTMAVSVPVTVGAMVLAQPLIVGWVGASYSNIAVPARLLLVSQLIATTASIALTMLVGLGKVKQATLYALAAVVINLLVSVVLAPTYGIPGVIAGTLVGHVITAPLYLRLVLRELGVSALAFVKGAVLPVIPAVLVYVVILVLTMRLVVPSNLLEVALTAIPAAVVYVAIFAAFSMTTDERRALIGYIRPIPA